MQKNTPTKNIILEAAASLFSTSSYQRISVDEIAKAAGVSKGGLFHYFDSKYNLAVEAFQYSIDQKLGVLFTPDYIEKTLPEQQLKDIIDHSVNVLIRTPHLASFMLDLAYEALEKGEDPHAMTNFFREYVDLIQELYVKIKVINPRMKALLLMATLDGYGMYHMFLNRMGEKVDSQKLKRELYRMFIVKK